MTLEPCPLSAQEHHQQIVTFYESLASEKETFQLPLKSILQSFQLYGVLGERGEILGLSGLRKKWYGAVFFVVVKNEAQGKGYGKLLTQTCFNYPLGGKALLLTVEKSNKKAQELYQNLGMELILVQKDRAIMMRGKGIWRWLMRFAQFLLRPRLD